MRRARIFRACVPEHPYSPTEVERLLELPQAALPLSLARPCTPEHVRIIIQSSNYNLRALDSYTVRCMRAQPTKYRFEW